MPLSGRPRRSTHYPSRAVVVMARPTVQAWVEVPSHLTRTPYLEPTARSVLIFNILTDRPVFHRFSDLSATTSCGMADVFATWIPLRHAIKFARPCWRCFR